MTRVVALAELRPAGGSPDFVKGFVRALQGVGLPIPADFTGVSVAESAAAERLWNLARLVFDANVVPSSVWSTQPPFLDVWLHGSTQSGRRQAVGNLGLSDGMEVLLAIDDDDCPHAISAPWRFCHEHVLPGLLHAVVMPPDATWLLANHHGEFLRGCRTRFTDVRAITFRSGFTRHDGVRVPKPRYEVTFQDDSRWESGDLRDDPARKRSLDSALAIVASLAAVPVDQSPS